MNERSDLPEKTATRRTYLLLQSGLFQLMMEVPFEKITMTQLCSRSMVPRSTFYRYFEDKYDLLYYSLKTFFESIGLEQDVLYLTNPEASRTFLTHAVSVLNRHKEALTRIYQTNKDGVLMELIRNFLIQLLEERLRISQNKGLRLAIAQPIFSYLLTDFYLSIAKCYLEAEKQYTIEEFVEYVYLFAHKEFFLQNPTN